MKTEAVGGQAEAHARDQHGIENLGTTRLISDHVPCHHTTPHSSPSHAMFPILCLSFSYLFFYFFLYSLISSLLNMVLS